MVPEAPVAHTDPQQRSQESQEDPGAPEVQGDPEDLQQSDPGSQGALENREVLVAPEDRAAREVQEVPVDPEVQKVPRLQHHDRVFRRRNQQPENLEPQGDQEVLMAPVDPVAREVRVCHNARL